MSILAHLAMGIFYALIGAVATEGGVRPVVEHFRARRGVLTGTWSEEIPQQGEEPQKRDVVNCRNIGQQLRGTIRREEPHVEHRKEWGFLGQIRGNLVFMIYWPTDGASNPGSYGTMQLHVINEAHLKGFYIKPVVSASERGEYSGTLSELEVEWRKR